MNTSNKLIGTLNGEVDSTIEDSLGNVISSEYITNVTWDSATSTLSFYSGNTLKYSCVINLSPIPLVDDDTKPLYLHSKQNGSTVTLTKVGTHNSGDVYQTSSDGSTWSNYTNGTTITLNNGEGVYFRISADRATTFSSSNYIRFSMSGEVEAYHNVNSLLSPSFSSLTDLTTVVGSGTYCHYDLFGGCTVLSKAPLLPATTLSTYCYDAMFLNCSSLTDAPTLPSTIMKSRCYASMFYGCSGLTSAPALPATSLATYCYASMFSGCTGLTQAQTTLPATTLAANCYQDMFNGCSKITQTPSLKGTSLKTACYVRMFRNCSKLGTVTAYATTNEDVSANTDNWLYGVKSSGTFYCKSSGADWISGSVNGIPSGWTRRATL